MQPLPSEVALGGELTVCRLGFGTIHLTERRGFGAARKNALELVALGVDFIDTADSYGPGTAEAAIHEALYPYKGITIATKGGFEHPAGGGRPTKGGLKFLFTSCRTSRTSSPPVSEQQKKRD